MVALTWDGTGNRRFETGVDHGVLYVPDSVTGAFDTGFAWNGLVNVTESPTGAEATPQYADNIKYLNLISAEEFAATLEAFTYPDEFAPFDGLAEPEPGVFVAQQSRTAFGLSYRTLIGNDLVGQEAGYKLHLVYNALATPSEKSYGTVNDSPEAATFSWDLTTTAVPVGTVNAKVYKPTAHLVVDSTKADPDALETLEAQLYGGVGSDPQLPLPAAVFALFTAP